MTTEQNKERVREFFDKVINGRDMTRFDDYLSSNFVEHEPLEPFPPTREGVRSFFESMRAAFPDLKVSIEDMVAEGDKVVARQMWRGTHKGEFMGVPASGKTVAFPVIDILRLADGKATDHWGVPGTLTMMQQIGAIPDQVNG
ncbi:MAG: hypothetical protein Kow0074_23990 [Candidatus Zixiibacteriota bacterium]